jgi:hypothetical protein
MACANMRLTKNRNDMFYTLFISEPKLCFGTLFKCQMFWYLEKMLESYKFFVTLKCFGTLQMS